MNYRARGVFGHEYDEPIDMSDESYWKSRSISLDFML